MTPKVGLQLSIRRILDSDLAIVPLHLEQELQNLLVGAEEEEKKRVGRLITRKSSGSLLTDRAEDQPVQREQHYERE